jgi:hypothetical protein
MGIPNSNKGSAHILCVDLPSNPCLCDGDRSSSQSLQIHWGINAIKFTLTSA